MTDLVGPPKLERPYPLSSVLARLGQATWEATQWMTYEEVVEYVSGVLREVESDEP
jgi:hypothetical protein